MSNWTPAHLKKLEEAIAKGVMSVQYEDRRIQYRSLAEMMQTRDLIKAELGVSKQTRGNRRRFARHDKGLN